LAGGEIAHGIVYYLSYRATRAYA